MSDRGEGPGGQGRRRVLIIGMLDSPHFARWLSSLRRLPIDVVLSPSSPNRRIHPGIEQLVNGSSPASYRLSGIEARLSLVIWAIDIVLGGRLRAKVLQVRVGQLQPNAIHAVELQHAGYTLLRALEVGAVRGDVTVALTNYGSDLFWFERFPRHRAKLTRLLRRSDFYSAECARDVELARRLGFRGRALEVLPNAGGLDVPSAGLGLPLTPAAERRVILIKGYTNFVGRAQDILSAIGRRSAELNGWNIVVYSATLRSRALCRWLSIRHPSLSIRAIPKKRLTHDEMLELFRQAAVYIGFSQSDGISTSFLEALACGAYPLQTNSACIGEWGGKGAVFSPLDVDDPSAAVRELIRVLDEPTMRADAAARNSEVARTHLDRSLITRRFEDDYRVLLGL